MELKEHLLVCAAEECSEIITELCDYLTVQTTDSLACNNLRVELQRLGKEKLHSFTKEVIDLVAVFDLLVCYEVLNDCSIFESQVKKDTDVQNVYMNTEFTLIDFVKTLTAVQYRACKLLRFGIEHRHPETGIPASALFEREVKVCLEKIKILQNYWLICDFTERSAVEAKQRKVLHYVAEQMKQKRITSG